MKLWRKNKTTIVITHDLSQIVPDDFVYVMSNGVVAEQGFRSDLMRRTPLSGQDTGVFAAMAAEQAVEPLAPKMEEWRDRPEEEEVLDAEEEIERGLQQADRHFRPHTPNFAVGPRPESTMYWDILDEYSRGSRFSALDDTKGTKRMSTAQKRLSWTPAQLDKRASRTSLALRPPSALGDRKSLVVPSRPASRMSRQPSYDTPPMSIRQSSLDGPPFARVSSRATEKDGRAIGALSYRGPSSQNLKDDIKDVEVSTHSSPYATPELPIRGLFNLVAYYFPTIPNKFLLGVGLFCAIGHGVSTPVWSFFLAKLMAIVGGGGTDPSLTMWGLVLLAVSAAQALVSWTQEYTLFRISAIWSGIIRDKAFSNVLNQDKGWFDESANSPARLVQSLIKDADDMRQIVASIMGKIAVFVSMVGLGIIWAFVVDWRLTLVGIALAPLFAIMMLLQDTLVGKAEVVNKTRREDLARTFYEVGQEQVKKHGLTSRVCRTSVGSAQCRSRIRSGNSSPSTRAMRRERARSRHGMLRLVSVLRRRCHFSLKVTADNLGRSTTDSSSSQLGRGGIHDQRVPVVPRDAASVQLGPVCPYVRCSYSRLQYVWRKKAVARLELTSVPMLAKSKAAARDFERFYTLTSHTQEATGELRFPISGQISFSHVQFAYPSRIDVPVLTDVSFTLNPGECVAIVGPSGSGKSTIAALLQRLYDPTGGSIYMDKYKLNQAETKWLRNHIAVVSQSANLFDASVSANIAYGSEVSPEEIIRAAKAANIHEFIMTLPHGYDTNLGENASLISGGQAQRLQIARALVRRSHILILDECTSALDVDNQRMILDTIVRIKEVSKLIECVTLGADASRERPCLSRTRWKL